LVNVLPIPRVRAGGAILLPHEMAYQDAYELPVAELPGSQPPPRREAARIAVVRMNELLQITNDEVKALAGNEWRFWLRWSMVQGMMFHKAEPLVPIARPYPFLDSSLE
jgi:hypothetical protein